MLKTRFESIGMYLPEKIVSTRELINKLKIKSEFDLENVTGIKNRRFRSETETSLTMALEGAQSCLKNSKYTASDLDVLIYASITQFKEMDKFYLEPTISYFIKKEIGAQSAITFAVTNACASMLNGAFILDNMIRSGAVKNGMVVSGECISPTSETALKEIKDPIDNQFASLTLGDSGSAFIMDAEGSENEGIEFIDFITTAEFAHFCYGMPSNENPGIALYAKGAELNKIVCKKWPIFLEEVMRRQGKEFNPEEYDYIIFHQNAVRSIKQKMKTGRDYFKKEMPETLICADEYGNTSTTALILTLYDNLRKKKVSKGSKVLFLSTASGLVYGAISATLGELRTN